MRTLLTILGFSLVLFLIGCQSVNPDGTVNPGWFDSFVPEFAKAAKEAAPDNPTDLTGWILAGVGALGVAGTAATRKYLAGRAKKNRSA